MSFWPKKGRKEPYTADGIKRVPCVRCGGKALHQWQICADHNQYRALCIECDIALNKMVLSWANDPNASKKHDRYAAMQRKKNALQPGEPQ